MGDNIFFVFDRDLGEASGQRVCPNESVLVLALDFEEGKSRISIRVAKVRTLLYNRQNEASALPPNEAYQT